MCAKLKPRIRLLFLYIVHKKPWALRSLKRNLPAEAQWRSLQRERASRAKLKRNLKGQKRVRFRECSCLYKRGGPGSLAFFVFIIYFYFPYFVWTLSTALRQLSSSLLSDRDTALWSVGMHMGLLLQASELMASRHEAHDNIWR